MKNMTLKKSLLPVAEFITAMMKVIIKKYPVS